MQISSMTVQNDDSVQLLKQTLSLHSGLDASHHLHRLKLRWLKDWTTSGSPAGENTRTASPIYNSVQRINAQKET